MDGFGSVLNCIDGRAQRPAADYLSDLFGVGPIDAVTAPGMVKHLAQPTDRTAQILDDLRVSLTKHASTQIGVVSHADCAGNPVDDEVQQEQTAAAVANLRAEFPQAEVVGVWLDIHGVAEPIG